MLFAAMVTGRFFLGGLFAALGGVSLYIMTEAVLLSFYTPSQSIIMVSTIVGGGVGAGIGGFLGWFSHGDGKRNFVVLGLALAGGFGGGQLGLLRGEYAEHVMGMPGVPELGNLVYGTVIGANLLPLFYFVLRRLRGERLV